MLLVRTIVLGGRRSHGRIIIPRRFPSLLNLIADFIGRISKALHDVLQLVCRDQQSDRVIDAVFRFLLGEGYSEYAIGV